MSYELKEEEISNIIHDAYTLGANSNYDRTTSHTEIMDRIQAVKSDTSKKTGEASE